ncbi:uncharacterized protein PADG_11805 [Paracoccidioides brasiliensis Pb18]|uniref:Uncharacterized protein n=1 Tax=Paracoccidioides brasiliensis (strain Pb18) TaxID=502780 RepID=A0A0A0HUI6_PARBD|nr:uncharacterized protein PADG_11805 [Paracoccidioides brasiliensis Pb18]KGM92018.1 hypothetical protein PADG_11805 [Paracoccidioides brasiliensis Pb18]
MRESDPSTWGGHWPCSTYLGDRGDSAACFFASPVSTHEPNAHCACGPKTGVDSSRRPQSQLFVYMPPHLSSAPYGQLDSTASRQSQVSRFRSALEQIIQIKSGIHRSQESRRFVQTSKPSTSRYKIPVAGIQETLRDAAANHGLVKVL